VGHIRIDQAEIIRAWAALERSDQGRFEQTLIESMMSFLHMGEQERREDIVNGLGKQVGDEFEPGLGDAIKNAIVSSNSKLTHVTHIVQGCLAYGGPGLTALLASLDRHYHQQELFENIKAELLSAFRPSADALWRAKYKRCFKWMYDTLPVKEFAGNLTVREIQEAYVSRRSPYQSQADLMGAKESKILSQALIQVRDSVSPYLVLLGNQRCGKSTQLRKICLDYLDKDYLPVFLTAHGCVEQDSIKDYLERGAYLKSLGMSEEFGPLLWNEVLCQKAPIVIDSLEGADQSAVAAKIRALINSADHQLEAIIVACRNSRYRNSLDNFEAWEMLPLGPEEIGRYAEARFKDESRQAEPHLQDGSHQAENFMAVYKINPRVRQLAENGLTLSMMTDLSQRRIRLPESRAKLYRKIVDVYMDSSASNTTRAFPNGLRKAVLEAFGFHGFFCKEHRLLARDISRILDSVTAQPRWGSYAGSEDAILEDLLHNLSLICLDEDHSSVRFCLDTFLEYFAAQFIVSRWDRSKGLDAWLPLEDGWTMRQTQPFVCPVCMVELPSFLEMIFNTNYRELLLLIMGLLEDTRAENIFLSDLVDTLPPISGFSSSTSFQVRFDTDKHLLFEPGIHPDMLDYAAVCLDIRCLLSFVLEASAQSENNHEKLIQNALSALVNTDWRSDYFENLMCLAQVQRPENAYAAVNFLAQRLTAGNSSSHHRIPAIQALIRLKSYSHKALPALLECIIDTDPAVRLMVCEAIGDLYAEKNSSQKQRSDLARMSKIVASAMKARCDGSRELPTVRAAAARALAYLSGQVEVEAQANSPSDQSPGPASVSAEDIPRMAGNELLLLLKSRDADVRLKVAVELIHRQGYFNPEAMRRIAGLLEESDEQRQQLARDLIASLRAKINAPRVAKSTQREMMEALLALRDLTEQEHAGKQRV